MNSFRFVFRSLIHFRKQNLALLGGTVLASMVLTGALIIGDSVRYSLKELTLKRLGSVQFAFNSGSRFVRSELGNEISDKLNLQSSSILILPGIGINQQTQDRINNVQVVGCDSSFWQYAEKRLPGLRSDEAFISKNLAEQLGLKPGDAIILRVEQVSAIPINVPLSPENQPSKAFRLIIKGIADDKNLGRFSLKSNQIAPFSVFMDRETLASNMELAHRCNTILLGYSTENTISDKDILRSVKECWNHTDVGIHCRAIKGNDFSEWISDRVFIDPVSLRAIDELPVAHEKIFTYLVNSLTSHHKNTPYSFVSGIDSALLPPGTRPGDIIINRWLADDLNIGINDSLRLEYFVIGPLRKLVDSSRVFKVTEIIPVEGNIADREMMPDFPGLKDAGSCRDWNTGIPIDLKRIRNKDEKYWDDFRGTPKALICLQDGLSMWKNSFGQCTSVRFRKDSPPSDSLFSLFLSKLDPTGLGMNVSPILSDGITAASHSVDFGQLFLGLSFFIIAAAILLLVLIFSMGASARSGETALLSGLGIPDYKIFRIQFWESFLIISAGSMIGAIAGIVYNRILVYGLNTVWQGAVQTNMLMVHIRLTDLLTGTLSTLLVSSLTIFLYNRRLLKIQISSVLKENTQSEIIIEIKRKKWWILFIIFCFSIAAVLVFWSIFSGDYQNPVLFLSAGSVILLGFILSFPLLLNYFSNVHQTRPERINYYRLSLRNIARNKSRSQAVVAVLAIGIFSIILTGAYRKTFTGDEMHPQSGTGGFQFWAETSVPIPANLNSPETQKKYFLTDSSLLGKVSFEQLPVLDGDDASCLNLNQVRRPRILGVNATAFDRRQAFSFLTLAKDVDPGHPWLELKKKYGPDVIPAFADQTVIQYGLMKSVGDTLWYTSEQGKKLAIVLAGGLDNSIFQGNILIDDSLFPEYFPSQGGSRVMLLDLVKNNTSLNIELIRRSLADYGIELESATERLASYNAVENTYLSVFMILGGLGLMIGTIGLALVLFRNILERKRELALLSALGFLNRRIRMLVFVEQLILFTSGLSIGLFAAGLAIIPSLTSPGFETQTKTIFLITIAVFVCGLAWSWLIARLSGKVSTPEALRNN